MAAPFDLDWFQKPRPFNLSVADAEHLQEAFQAAFDRNAQAWTSSETIDLEARVRAFIEPLLAGTGED